MPLKTLKTLGLSIILLSSAMSAQLGAQARVELKGSSYGRPGYGASMTVYIIGKEIFGPVRFIQELPQGWSAKSLEKKASGKLSMKGRNMRILWLEMPVVDTVRFTYELSISPSQSLGYVSLPGKLEYFDAQGNRKTMQCSPANLRIIPYFSRYQ